MMMIIIIGVGLRSAGVKPVIRNVGHNKTLCEQTRFFIGRSLAGIPFEKGTFKSGTQTVAKELWWVPKVEC